MHISKHIYKNKFIYVLFLCVYTEAFSYVLETLIYIHIAYKYGYPKHTHEKCRYTWHNVNNWLIAIGIEKNNVSNQIL